MAKLFFLILESNTFNKDGLYLSFTTANEIWSKKIFEKRTDVNNEGVCSAICTLNYPKCSLFVYENNECLLGSYSKTNGNIVLTTPGETLVHLREGEV